MLFGLWQVKLVLIVKFPLSLTLSLQGRGEVLATSFPEYSYLVLSPLEGERQREGETLDITTT